MVLDFTPEIQLTSTSIVKIKNCRIEDDVIALSINVDGNDYTVSGQLDTDIKYFEDQLENLLAEILNADRKCTFQNTILGNLARDPFVKRAMPSPESGALINNQIVSILFLKRFSTENLISLLE